MSPELERERLEAMIQRQPPAHTIHELRRARAQDFVYMLTRALAARAARENAVLRLQQEQRLSGRSADDAAVLVWKSRLAAARVEEDQTLDEVARFLP